MAEISFLRSIDEPFFCSFFLHFARKGHRKVQFLNLWNLEAIDIFSKQKKIGEYVRQWLPNSHKRLRNCVLS